MKIKLECQEIKFKAYRREIRIKRNSHGIPCINAENHHDMLYGLGWVHAHDRLVAMELTRLIAKGVAAEHLDPSLVNIDIAMRRYNLRGDSAAQSEKLSPEASDQVLAYCSGVNSILQDNPLPFEFKLIGHKPEPWTPADCIMMMRFIGIVDMTETQGWMEKFIIQVIQKGIAVSQLKELFPYLVETPGPEYLEIIRKVRLADPVIPETVNWNVIPRFQCSNNWAVSGKKTASGKPVLCGDPHLDTSRLPAIWQEVVMRAGDYYFMGATVPGVPSPALGRTNDLAWSPTYGYMDVIDYFIEEVKGGKYRRGDSWRPFSVREETVNVRKGRPLKVRYYENEHGVLDQEPVEDGYYLCFAWSAGRDCGAETTENMIRATRCKTVAGAMPYFSMLDFAAFNWVIADREGNIGYQMSGRCPVRAEGCSGLLPLPGWDEKYDWKGYHGRDKNPSLFNPEEGFIATANQDLNHYAAVPVINLPMAGYRAERISEMIASRDGHTVETMKAMHYDLYSRQAEIFMPVIRPLLPDSIEGDLLKEWNLCYESASAAATIFESVYLELVKIVFGENGIGKEAMEYLITETILFHDFYGNFDRVILQKESLWFGGKSRDEIFLLAIERGLKADPVPFGSTRKVLMKNLFFGGKLPKFLGFDYGPIELIGSRATIPQGQIFKTAGGRVATFSPAYKFITDFAEDKVHSAMAGGPSDRRFSKWYTSGVGDWLEGKYKILEP